MIQTPFKNLMRRMRSRRSSDSRQTHRDFALVQRLYRTFEHDLAMTQVRGLQFYVQNGTVTLYGIIRHELDRELLLSFIRQIPGVKGVVERLQVVDQLFQEDEAELSAE